MTIFVSAADPAGNSAESEVIMLSNLSFLTDEEDPPQPDAGDTNPTDDNQDESGNGGLIGWMNGWVLFAIVALAIVSIVMVVAPSRKISDAASKSSPKIARIKNNLTKVQIPDVRPNTNKRISEISKSDRQPIAYAQARKSLVRVADTQVPKTESISANVNEKTHFEKALKMVLHNPYISSENDDLDFLENEEESFDIPEIESSQESEIEITDFDNLEKLDKKSQRISFSNLKRIMD